MNLPVDYKVHLDALWAQWNESGGINVADIQWLLELAVAARAYCAALDVLTGNIHSMGDVEILNDAEAKITALLQMDTSK